MTEFWVSQKQYWCKYCEIFIRDDAPSRRQHENGLRHQGNKERFVRNLYKQGEKRKKDADEEKREMARIEQAAQAAFSADIASGNARHTALQAGPSSSKLVPTPAAKLKQTVVPSSHIRPVAQKPGAAPPPTATFDNYTTAEQLGFTDPDVERAQAEAAKRQTMGFVGDWQVVETTPPPPPPLNAGDESAAMKEEDGVKMEERAPAPLEVGNKRPAEDNDEEDGRGWKLRKKTASVGLGEIYDPGVIAIKPRVKAPSKAEESPASRLLSADPAGISSTQSGAVLGADAVTGRPVAAVESGPQATTLPKWAPTKWKKAGESSAAAAASPPPSASPSQVDNTTSSAAISSAPTEQESADPLSEDAKAEDLLKVEDTDVKAEESLVPTLDSSPTEPAPSLFKKRRPPAGGGSRGRRG